MKTVKDDIYQRIGTLRDELVKLVSRVTTIEKKMASFSGDSWLDEPVMRPPATNNPPIALKVRRQRTDYTADHRSKIVGRVAELIDQMKKDGTYDNDHRACALVAKINRMPPSTVCTWWRRREEVLNGNPA